VRVTRQAAAAARVAVGATAWSVLRMVPTDDPTSTPLEAILLTPPAAAALQLQRQKQQQQQQQQQQQSSGTAGDSSGASSSGYNAEEFTEGGWPLLVVPHGGPHSCMPTMFVPAYAYLCMRGFAILVSQTELNLWRTTAAVFCTFLQLLVLD
jgi:hypothetical protein